MQEVIMGDYHIRKYKDSDYEMVCTTFTDGMMEHIPAARSFILKNPTIQILICGVFLTLLICSNSLLFSLLAIALLLAAGWHFLDVAYQNYVDQSLRDDLMDIRKSYIENDGSCFWVAESNGDIMGMVGAQFCRNDDEEPKVELKRMSVKKCYRKGGIGNALCRTVLNFARQRGYNSVVLHTSNVQYAAQRLYESLGFRKIDDSLFPTYFGKLLNFHLLYYRYDIQPEVK